MADRLVLVSGASGFLGSATCAALLRRGYRVRALAHRRPVHVIGAETFRAELGDPAALAAAAQGVTDVVHLAARVHVMRDHAASPLAAFRATNVLGTRSLLDAAVAAGVTRFVFISSVKAVAEQSEVPLSSSSHPEPTTAYGLSKLEGEHLVEEYRSSAFHSSILRLPLVYGPRMVGNMLRLFRLVDRGLPVPCGKARNGRSVAYVENVAAAILHVLDMPGSLYSPFFVGDNGDLSTIELVQQIGAALGRRPRILSLSPRLLSWARTTGNLGRGIGLSGLVPALERLTASLRLDTGEFQRATHFRPPYTTTEGLRETPAWYRGRGDQ